MIAFQRGSALLQFEVKSKLAPYVRAGMINWFDSGNHGKPWQARRIGGLMLGQTKNGRMFFELRWGWGHPDAKFQGRLNMPDGGRNGAVEHSRSALRPGATPSAPSRKLLGQGRHAPLIEVARRFRSDADRERSGRPCPCLHRGDRLEWVTCQAMCWIAPEMPDREVDGRDSPPLPVSAPDLVAAVDPPGVHGGAGRAERRPSDRPQSFRSSSKLPGLPWRGAHAHDVGLASSRVSALL